MGKTCFFIGHREAPEGIFPALAEAVEAHIARYGVTEFIVGGYGSFDALAARAVIAAKQLHPGVILTRLLAYHPAERNVSLKQGFDGSLYPPGLEKTPRRYAIVQANRYAAAHADFLIAYLRHIPSNTRKLVDYARQSCPGLQITLL